MMAVSQMHLLSHGTEASVMATI